MACHTYPNLLLSLLGHHFRINVVESSGGVGYLGEKTNRRIMGRKGQCHRTVNANAEGAGPVSPLKSRQLLRSSELSIPITSLKDGNANVTPLSSIHKMLLPALGVQSLTTISDRNFGVLIF
ncbi:hypothetical protein J1N35_035105 [Gossypium stocksii]|uniref:Uncharacterized protein n=1 Tax=Gossypium stocksii TaxID=47602 RepID=A0A9D3ZRC5_9ROSI|nr:hypothetical protein J1N35_035105 [Gossypium stocksii]